MLTHARLIELLDYDPATGFFTWKPRSVRAGRMARIDRTWNTRYAGRRAGWTDDKGYWGLTIDTDDYRAHRLAWFHVNGAWPEGDLDHRDMDKGNCALSNLRPATMSQNRANRAVQSNNKCGLKGVSPRQNGYPGWRATIKFHGRCIHIGYFATPEAAHEAYVARARELFGEFARAA